MGRWGGILTPLSPNVITKDKYSFSEPLIEIGPVLVVPANSPANSLADLNNDSIIAVYQFDESTLIAQQYPTLIIRQYQSKPQILEELAAGKVDAVLIPVLDARTLVPSIYPNQLKIIDGPLNQKAIRLVTLKDKNSSLIKYFNRGIKKLHSSGAYQQLLHTYSLE